MVVGALHRRWGALSRSTTARGPTAPPARAQDTSGKRSSRSASRNSSSSGPFERAKPRQRTREARSLRPVPLARARIPAVIAGAGLRDANERAAALTLGVGHPDLERRVGDRAQICRLDRLPAQYEQPRAVA